MDVPFLFCSYRRHRGLWSREGSDTSDRSSEPPTQRSSCSQSTTSFEEVESLDMSHSRSQSSESSSSFPLFSQSGSRSFDMDMTSCRDMPPGMYPGRMIYDYGPPPTSSTGSSRGYFHRRMSSTDRSSIATNTSNSTFDEVESIDFGGQHELDFDPSLLIRDYIQSRGYYDDRERNHGRPSETDHQGFSSSNQSHHHSKKSKDHADHHSTSTDDSSSSKKSEEEKYKKKRGRDLIVPDDDKDEEGLSKEKESHRKMSHDSTSSDGYSLSSSSLIEQLLEFKGRSGNRRSDSQSTTSSFSPSSATSVSASYGDTSGVKFPYESDYEFHVRKRRMSQCSISGQSQNSSGSRPGLSSAVSIDSSSSETFSSSSPSDPYYYYNQPANAEDVLLNLGFCASDSFLPERFARDWFEKIMDVRRKRIQQFQHMELADMLEGIETPRDSRSHSGKSTPMKRKGSISDSTKRRGSTSEFLHKLDVNSRTLASTRRSRFRRAATMNNYHQDDLDKLHYDNPDKNATDYHNEVEKQDSIDQLKYVLERQASILNDSPKERRHRQFASCRQKSLPLCLETLSEEEEGRATSRGTSLDKGRLKSFLEEEERLSRSSSKDSDLSKANSSRKQSSGSVTSTDYSDIDMEATELHQPRKIETFLTLPDDASKIELTKNSNSEAHVDRQEKLIPSIVVSVNRFLPPQSSSSLEVAEIMDSDSTGMRSANEQHFLQVEPAMISVVLSDVEDSGNEGAKWRCPPFNQSLSEDRLCPPSPTSGSLAISPIPVSPVTVIEMEHLDNINDSLDSGDSVGDVNMSQREVQLMVPDDMIMSSLQPISEEELLSSDQSRQTSFDDSSVHSMDQNKPTTSNSKHGGNMSSSVSNSGLGLQHSKLEPVMHDIEVEANDGKLSPIIMFSSITNTNKYLQVSCSPDTASQCESAYGSYVDEPYKDGQHVAELKDLRDIGIQKDDGTLSPIMFCPIGYDDWLSSAEAYLAADQATQSDIDSMKCILGVSCMETQTEDCQMVSSETQTPQWLSSITNTTVHFEPMCVCCNVGCQTEDDSVDKQTKPLSVGGPIPAFTSGNYLLCSSCTKMVKMSSEGSSFDTDFSVNRSLPVLGGMRDSMNGSHKVLNLTIERLAQKTRHIRDRTLRDTESVTNSHTRTLQNKAEYQNGDMRRSMSLPLTNPLPTYEHHMRNIIEESIVSLQGTLIDKVQKESTQSYAAQGRVNYKESDKLVDSLEEDISICADEFESEYADDESPPTREVACGNEDRLDELDYEDEIFAPCSGSHILIDEFVSHHGSPKSTNEVMSQSRSPISTDGIMPQIRSPMPQRRSPMPTDEIMPQSRSPMPQRRSPMPTDEIMPQSRSPMPQRRSPMPTDEVMPQSRSSMPTDECMLLNMSPIPHTDRVVPLNRSPLSTDEFVRQNSGISHILTDELIPQHRSLLSHTQMFMSLNRSPIPHTDLLMILNKSPEPTDKIMPQHRSPMPTDEFISQSRSPKDEFTPTNISPIPAYEFNSHHRSDMAPESPMPSTERNVSTAGSLDETETPFSRLEHRRRSSLMRQSHIQLSSLALMDEPDHGQEQWVGWENENVEQSEYREQEWKSIEQKKSEWQQEDIGDKNMKLPEYFLPQSSDHDSLNDSLAATSRWVDNHVFITPSHIMIEDDQLTDNLNINGQYSTEKTMNLKLDVENANRKLETSSSTEKDQLAASIVTDLFQSVGLTTADTCEDKNKILTEIAMDYTVMKAVNNTIDKVLLSSNEGSRSYADTFAQVDELLLKAEEISHRRIAASYHSYSSYGSGKR